MKKLNSFAEFSAAKSIQTAAALEEEQEVRRAGEADSFKSLLTDFGVSAIHELSEDQRSDFFSKLRNLGVNESSSLITEGTRSQVGVISKSGKITSTYVHSDGYPEHMLPMLNGYSESDIKKLMKLGKAGISFLDKSIGKKHSFSNPISGYTIFYGRDRGENNDMQTTGQYRNVDQYLNDISAGAGAEWVYLWDEEHKNWLVADLKGDKELMPSSTFESVVTEDENTIGGLNKMANTNLERIADYANMIKDRMSQGQTLDAWMYSKISDSVKSLNSVHDTMDGNDGVIETLEDKTDKRLFSESVITEAEIKSDEDFKEYAYKILQKAFGDDFDQAKADEVVDGILGKSDGDYGKAAGILQSSLA